MNSIKLSLFDIFGYTLPGLFILIGILILSDKSLQSLVDAINVFKNINLPIGILIILIAYVLGFSFDSPGSWYYYKIGCKIFKDPKKETRSRFNFNREKEHEMLVMVRDKSPINNEMLQTWKLLKTMSHNLSFSFLLIVIISLVKILFFIVKNPIEWYILSGFCFILSIILLYRAIVFESWFYNHLVNTARALNFAKLNDIAKKEKGEINIESSH